MTALVYQYDLTGIWPEVLPKQKHTLSLKLKNQSLPASRNAMIFQLLNKLIKTRDNISRCLMWYWSLSLRLHFLWLVLLLVFRVLQSAKQLIHEDKVMPIVFLVVCVMDCVVLCTKDGPHLPVDIVMDVCGPHSSGKQKDLMRQEVHGAVQHGPCVRDGLQNTINGMESKASERREGMPLVVFVVGSVQVPVGRSKFEPSVSDR